MLKSRKSDFSVSKSWENICEYLPWKAADFAKKKAIFTTQICLELAGERNSDREHPDHVPSLWPQMTENERQKRKNTLDTYLRRSDSKR